MKLPEHILYCIQTLERAGFPAYAVGGCVRDALLGIRPHDYDLCRSRSGICSRHIPRSTPEKNTAPWA